MSVVFDPVKHTYFVNGHLRPSVTQILCDEGFINTAFFTDKGRERGTAIHDHIKAHSLGQKDHQIAPEYDPYFEGFLRFKELRDWYPHTIEKPMGNLLFAGTADQIGYLDGIESVCDFKSGGISAATGLQLAGYEILYGKKLNRFALQLFDGPPWYKITTYTDRNDAYIFQSTVAIWHYRRNKGIIKERNKSC